MLLAFTTVMTAGFVACDDDFSESVFDTVDYPLDRTAYTFPLDTFVKVNYLEPYNLRFIYKMEDVGSDMNKNLVPARYEQSKKLAVLSKYLWYDIYEKYAGQEFLRQNSPRIIHVVGSKSLNPQQGTETLGVAEGGIKITLYGANEIDTQATEQERIDYMTKYFYNTMHHEFGHILDQTKLHPTTFNIISTGHYDAMGWGNTPDSVSTGKGFVSSYASKSYSEDLVETAASYITLDTLRWEVLLSCADYEWEYIDSDFTTEDAFKNAYPPSRVYRDTVGYFKKLESGGSKIYRKLCKRDADNHVVLSESALRLKELRSIILSSKSEMADKLDAIDEAKTILPDFDAEVDVEEQTVSISDEQNQAIENYVRASIQWIHDSGVNGREVILSKLNLVRSWLNESFGYSIDDIRREVQQRQWLTDADGNFIIENDPFYGPRLVNRLTKPDPNDPQGRNLIDVLLDQVDAYKALQK